MAVAKAATKQITYLYEGTDKTGKKVKGQLLAGGETMVRDALRRQGIVVQKIKKQGKLAGAGKKITEKDIALFTRQLATMMKAGVPLLQAFDITAKSHANPAVQKLLGEIKADIETGSGLSQSFSKHPKYFDGLYCNLVAAGEQAGIMDTVLDRLAMYKEKMLAIKGKIKSAMMYPLIVIVVAFVITAGIMLFVIPAFKELFTSSGNELPALTQLVMDFSDLFVEYWWIIVSAIGGAVWSFSQAVKRSPAFADRIDKLILKIPVFGMIIEKATIARWSRTFSSLFAAGVPMVEALDSVAGASGNALYRDATLKIKGEVATGSNLTSSLQEAKIFPNMMIQMVSIGEESGSLDSMLGKVADFYEREVDEAVDALSSLMEPLIMVVLGSLIGTIVVAMYLPIFKMGSTV